MPGAAAKLPEGFSAKHSKETTGVDDPTKFCSKQEYLGPARFQTVEQALASAPMFYSHIVEATGSTDGREVACALDELRQNGRLGPPVFDGTSLG